METQERTIEVYVRLTDDEKGRAIGFRIPDDISSEDLLDEGFAIDGNQAVVHVVETDEWDSRGPIQYTSTVISDAGQNLQRILLDTEKAIVKFLGEHGYSVVFK